MDTETKRLKECIYAIIAALVNKDSKSALNLARVGMHGGSVNNPLDCENPRRNLQKP